MQFQGDDKIFVHVINIDNVDGGQLLFYVISHVIVCSQIELYQKNYCICATAVM